MNVRRISSLLLLLLSGTLTCADARVIDDFNPGSPRNTSWDLSQGVNVFSGGTASSPSYDGTPCLAIQYNKAQGQEWAYLRLGNLMTPPNVRDFSRQTKLVAEVYGRVKLLAKFEDKSGNESADIATVTAADQYGWTRVEWDYAKLDWRTCDRALVNAVKFFVQPGTQAEGSFAIDNIRLEPDFPGHSSARNLLVDDFNEGSSTNRLDGASGLWSSSKEAKDVVQRSFDADPGRARGRTGRSLLLRYGENAAGLENRDQYCGYWSGLPYKNLSNYSSLSFWARGTNDGDTFEFGLKDINGSEAKADLSRYLAGGLTAGAWNKVVIPLGAFSGVDLSCLESFSFTFPNWAKGAVWIDDIIFHEVSSWTTLMDFDGGNVVNGFGGSQGGLGEGSLAFVSTVTWHGAFAGEVRSGTAGLVDDFEHATVNANYYGGANDSTWNNAPNTTTTPVLDTAVFYGGAKSLKVSFDVAGHPTQNTGFWLNLNGHNVSRCDYLLLRVRGSVDGIRCNIGLKDTANREAKVAVTGYLAGGIGIAWQELGIRLSDFKAAYPELDTASLAALTFEFSQPIGGATAGTLYLDDVRFGRSGAWFTLGGADISRFNDLSLYLRGGSGGEEVRVRLQDTAGGTHDSSEVTLTAGAGWTRHTLALSAFSGVDLTAVNALHLSVAQAGENAGSTVYADEIVFGDRDYTAPATLTHLQNNGEPLSGDATCSPHNLLSARGPSGAEDASLEGVRFEFSPDGADWYTIGTDYDTDDALYTAGWNASELVGRSGYRVRAVAQDIAGNESSLAAVAGIAFQAQDVFLYPNPFRPAKGTGKLHFSNIPTGAALNIYTLSGELVATLSDDGEQADGFVSDGLISWNGRNGDGMTVASGIYLYSVTRSRERVSSGKFVVIR